MAAPVLHCKRSTPCIWRSCLMLSGGLHVTVNYRIEYQQSRCLFAVPAVAGFLGVRRRTLQFAFGAPGVARPGWRHIVEQCVVVDRDFTLVDPIGLADAANLA